MLRVGVNGYGTIGKRVADAIHAQPDMTVSGVAKRSLCHAALSATQRGYDLYAADADAESGFQGADIPIKGTVNDLIDVSDIIVDATPSGVGEANVRSYRECGIPAILQGGESADSAESSFNARANFSEAEGAGIVRVVSCNTTGLSRVLAPLDELVPIERVRATLIRRGGDPAQSDRGPIDDILPDPLSLPSHHAADVGTVLPSVTIDTMAVRVPTTRMHVHALNITFDSTAPSPTDVHELFDRESRIGLVPEAFAADGVGALTEFGHDLGRPRGDLWENCVWLESMATDARELFLFQAIDQQCNVVPENIDAIRAMVGMADQATSMNRTDTHLGIGFPIKARVSRPTAKVG